MPTYIIDSAELPTGDHLIHDRDACCSIMPPEDKQVILGAFGHCESAIDAGLAHYDKVDGCPECVPQCNSEVEAEAVNAAVAAVITVSNI